MLKEWSDFGVIIIHLGFGGCLLLVKCVTISLISNVWDVGKVLLIRPDFSGTFPVVWGLNSSVRASLRIRFGTKFLKGWGGSGHKNVKFLAMRTNLSTYPRWEKTSPAVGQHHPAADRKE